MSNPILAFSARRRMRTVRTAILLTLYGTAVLLFGMVVGLSNFLKDELSIGMMKSGVQAYSLMLVFQFLLLLLVTPALTAGSISGERERQTLELLLVTNTGSLRIAFGKLMESFCMVLLLLVSSLPAMCVVLLSGGVTFVQVLTGMLYLAVTAFACLSVGLLASAIFRRTVASTVVAYLAVVAIGILTLLPLIGDVMAGQAYVNHMYGYSSSTWLIGAPGSVPALEEGSMILWGFVLNPALGLLALISEQTGFLRGTFDGISYVLTQIYDMIDFSSIQWYAMLFMATVGIVFDLLAACFVRPRRRHVRKGKKP